MNYLLKGDISGIQEFIFNIPSDGAARVLKTRSFFIQAVSQLCVHSIQAVHLNDTVEVLSDSGGSFFLQYGKSIEILKEVEKKINQELLSLGLYVTLTEKKIENWKDDYVKLGIEEETKKSRKYCYDYDAFEARSKSELVSIKVWKDFAKNLSKANAKFDIDAASDNQKLISEKTISLFGYSLNLNPDGYYSPTSFNKMALWEENNTYHRNMDQKPICDWEDGLKNNTHGYLSPSIDQLIDFDHFALQARYRTGTNKLGIAKLDIDNMGDFFKFHINSEDFKNDSDKIKNFFSNELDQLWSNEFFNEEDYYRSNILVVYAGGDDCFIIGAWDAILIFLRDLRHKFNIYIQQFFPSQIESLTLSAGLIIVNPEYPVIRIGSLAEEMLKKVKNNGKNGIAIFGEKFRWDEFEDILSIANTLNKLTEKKGESKGLIQKIRLSAKGYQALINGISRKGTLPMEKVWNLSWFILRGVKEENKDEVDRLIVTKYHDALTKAISNKIYSSALVYPFAARLAEFYNRKSINIDN